MEEVQAGGKRGCTQALDLSACFSETGFGHGGKRGIAILLKEFFQDLFFFFRLA
jgi:hypothetical protein